MKVVIDLSEQNYKIACKYTDHVLLGSYARAIKKGTPLPERATNGDMIKAMFPNIECRKDELGNVFVISSVQLGYIVFRESWWNAPYKGNLSEKSTGSESEGE